MATVTPPATSSSATRPFASTAPADLAPSLQPLVDRIIALVQKCYDVPVVIASRQEGNRLHFIGSAGFGARDAEVGDLPCGETIASNKTVLVQDIAADPAWTYWAGRGLGFYASVPLQGVEGRAMGALSLFDIRARDVEAHGMEVLVDFAGLLSELLAREPVLPSAPVAAAPSTPSSSASVVIELFQDAPAAVVLTDAHHKMLASNPAMARLAGHPESVLSGQSFLTLVPEESQEAEATRYRALLAGEREHYQADLCLIDGGGIDRPVHMTVSLVRDDEGRPAYAIRMFEETGQRRALLEELRLRDRAIATMPLALAMIDTTSPGHPILFCNPAFEALTGYRQVDVLGSNLLLLRGARTERGAIAALDEALRMEEARQIDLVLYRRGGVPFRARVTQTPVWGEQDTMTHAVWLIEDRELVESLREETNLLHAELERSSECLREAGDALADACRIQPIDHRATAMLERLYDDVPYLEARVTLVDAETGAPYPIAAATAGRPVPIDEIDPDAALDRRDACRLRVQMEPPGEQGAWCLDVPLPTGSGTTEGLLTLYAHPARLFDERAMEAVRATAGRFALPGQHTPLGKPPHDRERVAILPEA